MTEMATHKSGDCCGSSECSGEPPATYPDSSYKPGITLLHVPSMRCAAEFGVVKKEQRWIAGVFNGLQLLRKSR